MARKRVFAAFLTVALLGGGALSAAPAAYANPSDFSVTVTSSTAGATSGATASFTVSPGWATTTFWFTFPGWTANNTFSGVTCPTSVVVTSPGTPPNTVSECAWTNTGGAAVLGVNVDNGGISGLVRVVLADGMLTNPAAVGAYTVTLTELSAFGWNDLTQSLTIVSAGQTTPAWFQSYGRHTATDACDSTWHPSWGQWMNAGLGGWTCDREMFYTSSGLWGYRSRSGR